MRLPYNDLKKLSLIDFKIINTFFSSFNKSLEIDIDGAWFENADTSKILGKGKLLFYSWDTFSMKRFDSEKKLWTNILSEDFEPLREICALENALDVISLKGFGTNSGLWVEYEIKKPIIEIKFQELEGLD